MMKTKLWETLIVFIMVLSILVQPVYAAEDGSDIATGTTPPATQSTEETTEASETTEAAAATTAATTEETTAPTETEATTEAMTEATEDTTPEPAEPFFCYTFDSKGNQLDGYWDEQDGVWYLFITSTQFIADTDLYYTGAITEVSAGQLDTTNHTVAGAFANSGDTLELTAADETVHSVVIMQSDLPSVHIVLNGTTLDEIHADKDAKHKGNSIYIMDPSGNFDLTVEDSLEIKGRGNSTWREYEKKAYQIKFDSKTSVMGMGKAKKWVLLANASDDSMMRTQLVYNMAKKMDMGFVCSLEYVDLWIDGEYRGTFLIGDKVEPGSTRLDLSNDAGALFEHDEAFYMEEDYWVYSTMLGRHFVMKEIVEEEDAYIEAAMADFEVAVDELMHYLYSTPSFEVTLEDLSTMIDVDSFVKYYLVNEYTQNRESFATSFYWYKDGPDDVLHLGPLWDFDTCMGNDGTANTQNYGDEHVLFRNLLAAPAFYQRTMELLEVYRAELESMTDDVDVIKAQIEDSAKMNYLRWDVLGKPNPKGGADFQPTFDAAVSAVKTWLQGRESAFKVADSAIVTGVVSDDCYEMELCFRDGKDYDSVMFAVWSVVDGQDDAQWYSAKKESDGSWSYTVDLGDHNSAGMYRFDAFANGGEDPIATGRNYVETARSSRYQLGAEVSEHCEVMTISLMDSGLCSEVSFAVWSEVDGQNDLRWYTAQRNSEGLWTCDVDMKKHQSAGLYFIHAYSGTGSSRKTVDTMTTYVETAVVGPAITAEVSADCAIMNLTLENVEEHERIWMAVWSETDGQDDMYWYELQNVGQGTWKTTVDLGRHKTAGNYYIHAYGGSEGPQTLLVDTRAYVAVAVSNPLRVEVSGDCTTMELTMEYADGYDRIWAPVWSEENGQDDIKWYELRKTDNGIWSGTVDLSNHISAGNYFIHIYGGSEAPETLLTLTQTYVAYVAAETVRTELSADGTILELTVENHDGYDHIWAPVWSEVNAQDDIKWYELQEVSDGVWKGTVDLLNHGDAGNYFIHIYGGGEAPATMLAETTVYVEEVSARRITATVNYDNASMEILLKDIGTWDNIWVPVWSAENDQDDIQWYRPEAQTDGTYKVTVDLSEHYSVGEYSIHVYGGANDPQTLIDYTTVMVQGSVEELFAMNVTLSDSEVTVVLKDAGGWQNIWIPVWSEENGQDDIRWYQPALQADGTLKVVANLSEHGSLGKYNIHVYGGETAPVELLHNTTVNVVSIVEKPVIKAVLVQANNVINVTVTNAGSFTKVWLPVWSEENGADDMQWYAAYKMPNGDWQYTVDLVQHSGSGTYHIHAYAGETNPVELIAYTDVITP